MRAVNTIFAMLTAAAIGAAVPLDSSETGLDERQDSGCYPFEDPHCCIDYAVCECANGWFYQFNQDTNGCNPPWGIIGTDISALPGFCC
ncbi:hypothetical protein F5Y13DRAFT_200116 [Hypoxylon sp. FL1857]|nr:hypothetical protein F5Y13DRAFT_200116 [Hypoxylon sp. FL1857]